MKKLLKVTVLILALSLIFGVFAIGASAASEPADDYYEEDYYEEDIYDDDFGMFTEEGGRSFVIVIAVIFGLILPLLPLGYEVFMLLKEKESVEPVDYIILGLSCLWLLLGIALLIILL